MSRYLTKDEFVTFWSENPIIVLDTSSILDLYRFEHKTSIRILDILKSNEENLWIPSHVLEEYYSGKNKVINAEYSKYKSVTKTITGIIQKAESSLQKEFHRYGEFKYKNISILKETITELIEKIKEQTDQFEDSVSEEVQENNQHLRDDVVNLFLEKLIEKEQVGSGFSIPELLDIYQEGELRFRYGIPPGYKDIGKKDESKTKQYGDLVIWKELLDKASIEDRHFLFVTSDAKEDWWEFKEPSTEFQLYKTIAGPRRELISEYNHISKAGTDSFMMLKLTDFYYYLSILQEKDSIEMYLDRLQMQPEYMIEEVFQERHIEEIIWGDGDLKDTLLHDSTLNQLAYGNLIDIENIKLYGSVPIEFNMDAHENDVEINLIVTTPLTLTIVNEFSKRTDEIIKADLIIEGNLSIKYKVRFDEILQDVVRENEVISYDFYEVTRFKQSGNLIDLCDTCGKEIGIYSTYNGDMVCEKCLSHYDSCPDCGLLFEEGSLINGFCSDCQK